MDIRNWPAERIMQLPDCVFGRRWFVGMISGKEGAGADFIVSDEPLPDRMVVWGLFITGRQTAMSSWEVTFRLGQDLTYNLATVEVLPRIFPGLAHPTFVNEIWNQNGACTWWPGLRNYVEAQGKRLVMVLTTNDGTGYREFSAGLLISSVPREIPEWLISGQGKNQL